MTHPCVLSIDLPRSMRFCYQARRRVPCAFGCAPPSVTFDSPCLDVETAIARRKKRGASPGAVPKEGADSMGRRQSFLLGFLIILFLACQPVRAQAPDAQTNTTQDAPAAALQPATSAQNGLPPIADEPTAETPGKANKKKGGRLVPARIDPDVIRIQATGDAGTPSPAPAASSPPAIVPAGQATPTVEGSADGSEGPLSIDRLPLGKQEMMVSVNVQSPPNLNFEQPATVKIIVKNSGSTDAQGVVVRDELPPGLVCLSSQPDAQKVGDSLLSWRISTLPAGSDRVILLKVKPTKVART